MAARNRNEELSGSQVDIFEQLKQIFPNHRQSVIKRTVLRISEQQSDHVLERCIEELVNITDHADGEGSDRKSQDDKELPAPQRDVLKRLLDIFSNHDHKVLRTAVRHPSNQTEPVTFQSLLDQCIDDVLDGRTAGEADRFEELFPRDKEKRSDNDDDVVITGVHEAEDVVKTSTETGDSIFLTDDEYDPQCLKQIDIAEKEANEILSPLVDEQSQSTRSSSDSEHEIKFIGSSLSRESDGKTHSLNSSLSPNKTCSKSNSESNFVLKDDDNVASRDIERKADILSFGVRFSNQTLSPEKKCSDNSNYSPSDIKFGFSKDAQREPGNSHFGSNLFNSSLSPKKNCFTNRSNSTPDIRYGGSVFSKDDRRKPVNPFLGSKFAEGSLSPRNSFTSGSPYLNLKFGSSVFSEDAKRKPLNHCLGTKFDNCNLSPKDQLSTNSSNSTSNLKFDGNIFSKDIENKPEKSFLGTQFLSSLSPKSKSGLSEPYTITSAKLTVGSTSKLYPVHTFNVPSVGDKADQGDESILKDINVAPKRPFDWTSTKSLPKQQTVTIESTHKITYGNPVSKEGFQNTPNYMGAAPNLTVQVPLSKPDLQLIDEISTLTTPTDTLSRQRSSTRPNHTAKYVTDLLSFSSPDSMDIFPDSEEDDDLSLSCLKPQARFSHRNPYSTETIPVVPVVVEEHEDSIVIVKNHVLSLFPDVRPDYLDALCHQHVGPMAVNDICFMLIESKYPKRDSQPDLVEEKKEVSVVPTTIDYYRDYKSLVIPDDKMIRYQAEAFQKLSQEFLWLSANDIKSVMRRVCFFYAPSHKALHTVWKQGVDVAQKKFPSQQNVLMFRGLTYQAKLPAEEAGGMECRISIKLLKNRRPLIKTNFTVMSELQRELDFVQQKLKDKEVEADFHVAMELNEQEYEDEGQCIECGCCFGEYPFEQMVQCYEGHLFCKNCLRQYARESVFGQGKADMKCMTELCDSSFPKSQLSKALPSEMLAKYEDRVTEENLNLADLGDLVKCPHCDFRAFMDPGDKVFRCQSGHCKKESCRYCQVEWEEHFGKRCSEVEKKDETKIRLEYEEKMTKAKVRVCHRCKAQFMKSDGCNKMTCRCGAKMCYICRKPNIDYNHFCQHPRDPGRECTTCKACNLWTNPEEDENRAVAEIQKQAEEERKQKGFMEVKVIGVPDQPPAKKLKR